MNARTSRLAVFWLVGVVASSCASDGDGENAGSGGSAGHSHGAAGGADAAGGAGGSGDDASDICGPLAGAGNVGTGASPGTTPSGRLDGCYGPCPNGQCDSSDSFFEPGCAGLYPCVVNASFPFCNPDESVAYCLMTGVTPSQTYWLIVCDDGNASFELCMSDCSAPDSETYSCL